MPRISGLPGPYGFYFYSFDCNEPKHVHVRRDKNECKYWLEPVRLADNNGFKAKELNRIKKLLVAHWNLIVESWNEHCGEE